nr:hypothetical protein [Evansella caseinilytica]
MEILYGVAGFLARKSCPQRLHVEAVWIYTSIRKDHIKTKNEERIRIRELMSKVRGESDKS